jgi:hypothetical protein
MTELEIMNVDFCGGKNSGELEEKPSNLSRQGREPTTNPLNTQY